MQHPRKWRLVGVAVSTTDSESVDRGSNPRRAFRFVKLKENRMSRALNPFLHFSCVLEGFVANPTRKNLNIVLIMLRLLSRCARNHSQGLFKGGLGKQHRETFPEKQHHVVFPFDLHRPFT